MDVISDSEQQDVVFIDQATPRKHDKCTQTFNSFLYPENEGFILENTNSDDVERLDDNGMFECRNDYINKFNHDLDGLNDDNNDDTSSNDVYDNTDEIPEVQHNLFNDEFETERPPSATELSVMLLFLWRRHSMSKTAVTDICCILNNFNIVNMPKDFRGVMSLIKKKNPTLLHGNHSFICPSCSSKGTNASKCDTSGCKSDSSYVRTPTSVFTFPLAPQVNSILEREQLLSSTYESDQCSDILNSRRHHDVIMKEKQIHPERNIITLTIYNDGVLIKNVSRSLWITCACINELPRGKRFEINNMLICSISTGGEKPKKKEYSSILQDIVNELKLLENIGFDVVLPSISKQSQHKYTHFHAFTISAVCDKPAQALIMNIKDSTGFFSCGWCCIAGSSSFTFLSIFILSLFHLT
jgi:hypothetical protein